MWRRRGPWTIRIAAAPRPTDDPRLCGSGTIRVFAAPRPADDPRLARGVPATRRLGRSASRPTAPPRPVPRTIRAPAPWRRRGRSGSHLAASPRPGRSSSHPKASPRPVSWTIRRRHRRLAAIRLMDDPRLARDVATGPTTRTIHVSPTTPRPADDPRLTPRRRRDPSRGRSASRARRRRDSPPRTIRVPTHGVAATRRPTDDPPLARGVAAIRPASQCASSRPRPVPRIDPGTAPRRRRDRIPARASASAGSGATYE